MRKTLVDGGLISQTRIATGRQGGISLAIPTQKGKELAAELGIQVNIQGIGGPEHCYYQNTVKLSLESQGWKAVIEDSSLGRSIDVLATKDGQTVGYEISCDNKVEDEFEGVLKDLSLVDKVVVCCKTQAQAERLAKMVAEQRIPEGSAEFQLLSSFLGR